MPRYWPTICAMRSVLTPLVNLTAPVSVFWYILDSHANVLGFSVSRFSSGSSFSAASSSSTSAFGVYPDFPTPFWGLSGFFVGDLIGKALWELVENAQRFPRHGGRVLCVHGAVSFHRARPCATRWLPGRGPCVMSNWTAASSDCSRPANNYVRVNTVDLYTPNARFTPERLGYQVLTLFGKLGYSRLLRCPSRRVAF